MGFVLMPTMTRAELAAEVLRIHDLIAAEPGPRTQVEWKVIAEAVDAAREAISAEWHRAASAPQPRMVDGVGLCSVHCPHYFRDDYTEGCKHGGNGTVSRPTRSMVPCRPWVDALTQAATADLHRADGAEREISELRQELAGERAEKEGILRRSEHAEALNRKLQERIRAMLPDLQHEPAEERPCEQVIGDRKMCGTPTVCRNTSGYPMCRAHGGRNPVPEMNP